MADVQVDVLRINTAPAEKSMGSLKQQFKEVKEQMIEMRMRGEETSQAYKDLANRAGELSKAMKLAANDIGEASTTFTNTVSYVSGSLAGVSGAVQAATGALSLMGVEMGSDTKLMKALVAAMSITSGLTAIQASVEAFKKLTTNIKRSTLAQQGLNAAIKANPVTAIITGVVALTAAVVAFTKAVNDAREAQVKLQQEAKNQALIESYNELETKLNNIVSIMEIDSKTDTEIYEQKKRNAKALRDNAERNYFANLELLQNGTKAERKAAEEQTAYWKGEFEKRAAAYQALVDQNSIVYYKAQKDQEKKEQEAAKRRREAAKAAAQKQAEELKSDMAKITKANRDAEIGLMGDREGELAKLKDAYDEQVKLFEKRGQDIAKLTEYYRKQEAEINKKYDDKANEQAQKAAEDSIEKHKLELADEYTRQRLEILEKGEKDYQDKLLALEIQELDNEKIILKEQYDNNLITEEEFQNQLLELEEKYALKRIEIKENEKEKKKAIDEAYVQAAQTITQSLAGILGSVAEMVGHDTEAFKNIKAAQAIINTIAGAVAAFMGITESTSGWGIAAAIAQAAAVTAAGMAEVKKIYAVDTTGGKNSTSATVSTAAVNAITPNYNNTRLVSNGGGVYDLSQIDEARHRNTRVYVVTQDIEDGLNRVRVTNRRNTF